MDSLRLHETDLKLHGVENGGVPERLKHDVLLSQIYAHPSCLVIQWAFVLPVNVLFRYLTVVSIKVVARDQNRNFEVDPFFKSVAKTFTLLTANHSFSVFLTSF